ncbi:MAG: hypothetical protein WBM40_09355 [Thiohalocapsa sp.]
MKITVAGLILGLCSTGALARAPVQVWDCLLKDGVDEAALLDHAPKWLEAARKVDGGENLQGHIFFPVAIPSSAFTDVKVVLRWPNFAEFGKFWDAYPESDAAELEGTALECAGSAIWEEQALAN